MEVHQDEDFDVITSPSNSDGKSHGPIAIRPAKGNEMNLRKTLLSTIGAVAIVGGMFGGLVSAETEADVTVDYGCATTAGSVGVAVDGVIEYGQFDSSGDGATVEVTLDLTCNYSANFSVSATISPFSLQGPGSGNPLMVTGFGGEHFRMDNGAVTDFDFIEVPGFTSRPDVQETVFAGWVTEEDAIVEDEDTLMSPWGPIPLLGLFQASPGISVIEWDASVHYLPINLTPGTYQGEITVDLSVN